MTDKTRWMPLVEGGVIQEVRVTDPDTGGQKGQKLERFDLLPVEPLREVARVYGVGASKYEARNWEKGYVWSLSYAAAMRHLTAFWGGETFDPETGLNHCAHVVFHMLALMEYNTTHQEKDDRVNSPFTQQNSEALGKSGTTTWANQVNIDLVNKALSKELYRDKLRLPNLLADPAVPPY